MKQLLKFNLFSIPLSNQDNTALFCVTTTDLFPGKIMELPVFNIGPEFCVPDISILSKKSC